MHSQPSHSPDRQERYLAMSQAFESILHCEWWLMQPKTPAFAEVTPLIEQERLRARRILVRSIMGIHETITCAYGTTPSRYDSRKRAENMVYAEPEATPEQKDIVVAFSTLPVLIGTSAEFSDFVEPIRAGISAIADLHWPVIHASTTIDLSNVSGSKHAELVIGPSHIVMPQSSHSLRLSDRASPVDIDQVFRRVQSSLASPFFQADTVAKVHLQWRETGR